MNSKERKRLERAGLIKFTVSRPVNPYYSGVKANGLPHGYTAKLAREIFAAGRSDEPISKLAEEFNVHPTTLGGALTALRMKAGMQKRPRVIPELAAAVEEAIATPNKPDGFMRRLAEKHGVRYTSLVDKYHREMRLRRMAA